MIPRLAETIPPSKLYLGQLHMLPICVTQILICLGLILWFWWRFWWLFFDLYLWLTGHIGLRSFGFSVLLTPLSWDSPLREALCSCCCVWTKFLWLVLSLAPHEDISKEHRSTSAERKRLYQVPSYVSGTTRGSYCVFLGPSLVTWLSKA